MLAMLAFVGGVVLGWILAMVGYVAWFELTDTIDREGAAAMGMAFGIGPMIGLITGVFAALWTYALTGQRR